MPIVVAAAYTATVTFLGVLARRDLLSLRYRRASETSRRAPAGIWWVPAANLLAASCVSWWAIPDHWRSLLVATPLVTAGPWLAAVDLDVHRLPDRVLIPVGALTASAVVGCSAANPSVLIRALGCGGAGFALYFALHLASGGSIGFGDVKLAAIVGLVAGFHGIAATWWSFLLAPMLCLGWAVLTRRGLQDRVAFGPWLLAGLLAGLCLS